jgi:hypothetical protein
MSAVVTALKEVYGLFVEDGRYAVAIVAWLLLAALVLPRFVAASWRAPLLLCGLIVILIENVVRSAKRA